MSSDLPILFEDAHLLAIDKPVEVSFLRDRAGAPCVWDMLVARQKAIGGPRPLQVHRLDKGTSGVLLVALSREAQSSLTRQFADREVRKAYVAVTLGVPDPGRAVVDLPLREGRKKRYRVAGQREHIAVSRDARPARVALAKRDDLPGKPAFESATSYRVLRESNGRALVLLRPYTGRTHQLRVHLAWTGTPIVGDHLYGSPRDPAQQAARLLLHHRAISFVAEWERGRPRRRIKAPLPSEFDLL